jgi:hypothetical protein
MANIPTQYTELFNKFPFLSYVRSGQHEYVGIIQNKDINVVSMYVFELIKDDALKVLFLQLGHTWWWETNRQLPINIVTGERFAPFRPCLMTFNVKDFELLYGPSVCLRDIIQKRIKRKNIQLIKRVD